MPSPTNLPVRVSVSEWKERDRQFILGFHWCTKCKQFIPLLECHRSKGTRYGYAWHCKSCHNKNRSNPKYRKKARNYNRELKSYYKKLWGGTCAKCGYDKTQAVLDFHHINPKDKEYSVSILISTNNHSRIILELDKCILLCRNCHQELESFCWSAKFEKVSNGWSIKDGSIVEDETQFWTMPSDKILYEQTSF